ncbi:MAG: permease [Methanocellales archaeon]|nr:permease [Methanocellales archaeon]MDD3291755.1 permease [Methanocellales archaeon]MDD5235105.1 permease [Methanocellales archaeon]MDD5485243.1 permease [Methanocellales archaeon]
MIDIIALLLVGVDSLKEYLAFHVLMCLVPAFFLAGAIASLMSKESLLKYLGAGTKRYISYTIAATSGCLLAVCSCTALPLFAGIYKRGAGIGPATAFLYSTPAINILAVVYTAQVIGYDLGVARALSAVLLSILIGLVMAFAFERRNKEKILENVQIPTVSQPIDNQRPNCRLPSIFVMLIAILVIGPSKISWGIKFPTLISVIAIAIVLSSKWLTKDEQKEWMCETWTLVKMIIPLLLAGVFVAGIIVDLIPIWIIQTYLGGNSITSNAIASVSGALMYFATLTEVPIVGMLLSSGMGRGPALTLLLAGPALSLPNMIVIGRIMGAKRAFLYILLVITISLMSGIAFGYMIGM